MRATNSTLPTIKCVGRLRLTSLVAEVPSSNPTKYEMLDFARAEFERNRYVHDLSHIRYLISVCRHVTVNDAMSSLTVYQTGKTQLDSMRRYVEQNAM